MKSEEQSARIIVLDSQPDHYGLSPSFEQYDLVVNFPTLDDDVAEQVLAFNPDLILLENNIVEATSEALVQQLRSHLDLMTVPIVYMVDHDQSGQPFLGDRANVLIKPIHPLEIFAFLNHYHQISDLIAKEREKDYSLQQYVTQIELTSQIGQQITSILNPDELTKAVIDLLQETFSYYFVSLWQLNDRQDVLALKAGTGRDGYQPFSAYFTLHKDTVRSVVAHVARSGKAYYVSNVSQDSIYLERSELPDTRSELALPLHIGPRMVGVLDFQSDQHDAFDREQRLIFQSLADQIAVAIRNAELYDLQRRRRAQAELLERAGRVLTSTLDIRDVQARILEEVSGVIPYALGMVYLRRGANLHLLTRHGEADVPSSVASELPLRSGSALEYIFETGEPLVVDDLTSAPGWTAAEIPSDDFSWLGVPLSAGDRVVGILALTRADPLAFGPSDVIFLSTFAAQAAIALENAGLYAEVQHFSAHLEDLVEERTHQLDDAYKTLQILDNNKSDFINVSAHELRTPLTVIKGYISMLQGDATIKDNGYLSSMIDSVMSGVNRLHEIVNSMLDVAKINSQVLHPVCEWLTLPVALAGVKEEFSKDLQERNITLTIERMDDLPKILADPSLLYKVFYNVVVNAIKYTPDGGKIKITAESQSDARGDLFVDVAVRDYGIGVDLEHQALIFEQFYQVGKVQLHSSGRTKFKGGGPGLGLAIAKGIVDAHSGRIWLESERCDEAHYPGSTVHVYLPVNGPQPKEQPDETNTVMSEEN